MRNRNNAQISADFTRAWMAKHEAEKCGFMIVRQGILRLRPARPYRIEFGVVARAKARGWTRREIESVA